MSSTATPDSADGGESSFDSRLGRPLTDHSLPVALTQFANETSFVSLAPPHSLVDELSCLTSSPLTPGVPLRSRGESRDTGTDYITTETKSLEACYADRTNTQHCHKMPN